jgi:hypothetical protein
MQVDNLKQQATVSSSGQESDILYCRGLSKQASDAEVLTLLSTVASPIAVDFSARLRGVVWAKYTDIQIAHETSHVLHQRVWCGVSLSLKFELGVDAVGRPIVPKTAHNTIIRSINYGRFIVQSEELVRCSNYSHKSLFIGDTEFPFPSGLYLTRVIKLMRTVPLTDPLLELLSGFSIGPNYAKEISEAMAMVDAVERAIKFSLKCSPESLSDAIVYVLGDGKQPLCASSLCLHFPNSWSYFSIDPILNPIDVSSYSDRFFQHPVRSQEFIIPSSHDSNRLHIIVACHSHAPLSEFWHRVPQPKLAVVMPCCADYSDLYQDAVLCFEDFEVYSAKRRIHIYADL